MRAVYAALVLIGLAVPGVIITDLLSDAPRFAKWIARRAERLLKRGERAFYGWTGEVDQAAAEAAAGRRSRLSVVGMALGIYVAAVRQRVRARRITDAVLWKMPADFVKVVIAMYDPDPNAFHSESVWAEWIGEDEDGEDLYRIDSHVWFSEMVCRGDVVRTTFEPLEDRPGYGILHFAEVVQQSGREEVSVWNDWRVLPKRRLRRLYRRLDVVGMSSEWAAPQFGRGTLPEDPAARAKAVAIMRRRRVRWEVVERTLPLREDPDESAIELA